MISIAIILVTILLLIQLVTVFARYQKAGTLVDGVVLTWAAFMVAYPVSAIAHFWGPEEDIRGFYDLSRPGNEQNYSSTFYAIIVMYVASVALWFGMGRSPVNASRVGPLRIAPSLTILMGCLFVFIGVLATLQIFSQTDSLLESMLRIDRERNIGGGLARFVFMSYWLSWGVTFVAVYLLRSKPELKLGTVLFIALGTLVVLLNSVWTGTRGSMIVAVMPLIFVLQRLRPAYAKLPIVLVGCMIVAYVVGVTVVRAQGIWEISHGDLILSFLDWQVGRFSLIGLGFEIENASGFSWGSTLLYGLFSAVIAPARLLNVPMDIDMPRGITSIVGEFVTGDPDMNGIVPGAIAELYINFGIVGVGVGFLLIGRIARYCVEVISKTLSLSSFLLASYALTLICVFLIPGTITGALYYLVTMGYPVICLYALERVIGEAKLQVLKPEH